MLNYFVLKRGLDISISSMALIVTGLLILGCALAIKLTSPGPAFYRAKRAGRDGKPFYMLKLRTMRIGLDSPDRRVTEANDSRITPVGAALRAFKLDELPQFWNVLRGEMSIVGPRPEDWDIVENHFSPEQRQVLAVRPGIASPVDVDWYPDMTYHDPPPDGVPIQTWYLARHMPIQVAEGIRYVNEKSLWLDMKVLLKLFYCVTVLSWRPSPPRPLPIESTLDIIWIRKKGPK